MKKTKRKNLFFRLDKLLHKYIKLITLGICISKACLRTKQKYTIVPATPWFDASIH